MLILYVVRMAERSKAPDSRANSSMRYVEYSGPRMWAWVRIPLLTKVFDLLLGIYNYILVKIVHVLLLVGKFPVQSDFHRAGFEPAT